MISPWPQAVLAGVAGLLMFAAFVAVPLGGMVLIQVSVAPLMLAAMRAGLPGLVIAAATALIGAALVLPVAMVPVYAVVDVVPAVLVGLLAGRGAPGLGRRPTAADGPQAWYPPGRILAWISVASLGLLALFTLSLPGADPGMAEATSLAERVDQVVQQALDGVLDGAPTGTRTQVLATIPDHLPGMFLASWVARTAFCALIALWWAGRRSQAVATAGGSATRPAPDITTLSLPTWHLGVFGLLGLVGLVGPGDVGYLATNAAMGLAVPLVLMGLVLVHQAARLLPQPTLALIGFYGLFILGSRAAVAAMVVVGLVEVVLKWRRPPSASV